MSRKSEFSCLFLLCVVVLLAAAMSSAQTAPSQDADPNAAQPTSESGTATIAPSRPLMAYPKAQRLRNNPAARSRFLAELRRRAEAGAATKKASPAFGGTWQLGTNYAPNPFEFANNPLLLTDGTVIVSDGGFVGNWYKLTPDITGSYVNGTWTQIATMPVINGVQYAPNDNASAVLPDGRVIVMGGEYNWQGNPNLPDLPVDTNLGAIYDPVANTWTPVSAPAGSSWSNIGDAMSTVLADGTFLLSACCAFPPADALFDATNLTWTSTGAPVGGPYGQGEQGYTLLPNGNVLTVDIFQSGVGYNSAEQYDPASGTWSSAGTTGTRLYDICGSVEIGPAPLRPDGTVVQFGGYACGFDSTYPSGTQDPTGIYDSTTGTWSAGPYVPVVDGLFLSIPDGPAAVLPNGNILFPASPWAGYANERGTHFFEFTTANAINQVADAPGGVSEYLISNEFNFLVLPNGQILVDWGSVAPLFYTPTGSPDPSWAPVISTSPSNVYPGTTYTISGTQLNGLTQGAYYGDDFQMATNYPIVQITNSATGHVFYGRTFNVSNRSIAPGVSVSTDFTVPANIELGASSLVVIANGIPSTPVPVGVGYPLTTAASPTNGGTVTPASGTYYAPNAVVNLTATANPNYAFSSWTGNVANANSASTTVTMTGPQSVTANFAPTTVNVTVGANPAGVAFSVDGTNYSSAQMFTWNIGDMHTIGTTTPQYPFAGTQETFASWSDGGAINHTVTASAGTTSYTASFNTTYLLLTAAYPANGGTVAPASGAYYAANTVVNLSATANANYAFSNWTGNVANANSASTTVTMTGPQSVTANFVGAQLRLSASTLNFGTVYLNNAYHELSFTITNVGTSTVTIGSVTVDPGTATPAAYRLVPASQYRTVEFCKGQLKPKQVCSIAVVFTANAVGTQTATVDITDNAAGSPQQVGLTANVIDPVAALSPKPLAFGQHAVNSQTTLPVQLSNSGQTDLTIGNIAISGPNAGDYSQSNNCPGTLTATASCTIEVTFTPSAAGGRGAALTVSGNMATGKATMSISGTGH